MIVGICKLTLMIPACRSLKEKRRVVRRIKDRTLGALDVRISEVGLNDVWKSSELGYAVVGSDRRVIESLLDRTADFVESLGEARIIDQHKEIINA